MNHRVGGGAAHVYVCAVIFYRVELEGNVGNQSLLLFVCPPTIADGSRHSMKNQS